MSVHAAPVAAPAVVASLLAPPLRLLGTLLLPGHPRRRTVADVLAGHTANATATPNLTDRLPLTRLVQLVQSSDTNPNGIVVAGHWTSSL